MISDKLNLNQVAFQEIILKDAFTDNPPIVELLDHQNNRIGAIYLSKVKPEDVLITTTTNLDEKYFVRCGGVGVFFTFWRKIYK